MGLTAKPVGKQKSIMKKMENELERQKRLAKEKREANKKKQMKLFFQNSQGNERLIAEPSNREEVVKEINKFLDEHNYKSYYTQVCEDNGRLMIDVGSWSEFFYLEGMSFEDWTKGNDH